MWFEVKGQFPSEEEVRKGQALSTGTGIPTYIYFAPLRLPAPAALAEMTYDQFMEHEEIWHWDDKIGWLRYPDGPARWAIDLAPTADMIAPLARTKPRTGHWWWTECVHCGMVILKFHGQIGWRPNFGEDPPDDHQLYPSFSHATPRLESAYTAARSARFEFGAHGH